ncbi:MAG: glycosyltransferase family 4 protein [Bacteroidales bacterium]|nr:glycosyltransferase family 4 protein [Bacteroidales bacterium]MBN2761748.1 glycosyltransferase family 4 protein [Bacteroidales bacterium]
MQNKLEGIGRFTCETLRIITQKHSEHRFIFIFDRKFSPDFIFSSNITPVITYPQARHPVLWYTFFEWGVPPVLTKHNADLFLSPDGWLSLRTKTRSMAVIHDLNFFHFPEFIPWHINQYYAYFFPRFVHKAHRIATVSEFTRQDIVSRFGYDNSKIDVVYNGANELFSPVSENEKRNTQEKFANGCQYFLFTGLIHPRKNLTNLIRAFKQFKQSVNCNVKLLIVGSRKWWTDDMQKALEKSAFREEIIFTGRVDDESLHMIMASALALVYASHFEGFGIPILEAMYCDTPVITSETSSMPEVGGDAVLYVNPQSIESIKNAMLSIFQDTNLRNRLIVKARIQREKFTWKKTADKLWAGIEKCFEEGK